MSVHHYIHRSKGGHTIHISVDLGKPQPLFTTVSGVTADMPKELQEEYDFWLYVVMFPSVVQEMTEEQLVNILTYVAEGGSIVGQLKISMSNESLKILAKQKKKKP